MPYKDPVVRKAYHKKYSQEWEKKANRWANPKRRAQHKARRKKRWASGLGMAEFRRYNYNMLPEEYKARVKKQKNRCALCGRPERNINYQTGKRQSLSVDHDHITGQNRGLLCQDCNHGIGIFDESAKLLLRAIKYLNKWGNNGRKQRQ